MKILLVTDAWKPQVNGVSITIQNICETLRANGHHVLVVNPYIFFGIYVPGSGKYKLSFGMLGRIIDLFDPDFIHVFTEGPLGISARNACYKKGLKFTTGYHTKFPEILKKWYFIPECITRMYLKWFHSISEKIMVPTVGAKQELYNLYKNLKNKDNVLVWGRGFNSSIFYTNREKKNQSKITGKKLICVSRVSPEKNLEDFCMLSNFGYDCTLVGDGSSLSYLKNKYKSVNFCGELSPQFVANELRKADLFIFPSKNDTFGLVMLEANACGLPVVGYPVTGPKDWVKDKINGVLAHDESFESLKKAIEECFENCSPRDASLFSESFTWNKSAEDFLNNLALAK
jgi:glycosyltransferase involved in cell wall biosynthesis